MILAAGRGERLRPLTDMTPKALCKIHNIALIEYHIIHLAKAGFGRVIINHAHLGGQIRRHLGDGLRWGIEIIYSPEPPGGLETGGGIVQALPLLGPDPFITVNADVFTDYNFASLGLPEHSLAHLVLVNKPEYASQGDFGLWGNKLSNQDRQYTFAGITAYHPGFFQKLKPGRYSVIPLMRAMIDQELATAEVHPGIWFDIGSPERLELANRTITGDEQPLLL